MKTEEKNEKLLKDLLKAGGYEESKPGFTLRVMDAIMMEHKRTLATRPPFSKWIWWALAACWAILIGLPFLFPASQSDIKGALDPEVATNWVSSHLPDLSNTFLSSPILLTGLVAACALFIGDQLLRRRSA